MVLLTELKRLKLFELADNKIKPDFHAKGSYGVIYKVPFTHSELLVRSFLVGAIEV